MNEQWHTLSLKAMNWYMGAITPFLISSCIQLWLFGFCVMRFWDIHTSESLAVTQTQTVVKGILFVCSFFLINYYNLRPHTTATEGFLSFLLWLSLVHKKIKSKCKIKNAPIPLLKMSSNNFNSVSAPIRGLGKYQYSCRWWWKHTNIEPVNTFPDHNDDIMNRIYIFSSLSIMILKTNMFLPLCRMAVFLQKSFTAPLKHLKRTQNPKPTNYLKSVS